MGCWFSWDAIIKQNGLNRGIKYLLCAADLISKHPWVFSLKDKRGVTIVNAFQNVLDSPMELRSKSREAKSEGCKPSKIWVDKVGEFYNNVFKRFLKINNTEGKSVFAERFIRTLKSKHMTAHESYFKKCLFWCVRWYG